jgi:hypothetical protein
MGEASWLAKAYLANHVKLLTRTLDVITTCSHAMCVLLQLAYPVTTYLAGQ